MRNATLPVVAVLLATVALLAGCGDADTSRTAAADAAPAAGASNQTVARPAVGRVAFEVSGMKKTASGAT